MKRTETSVSNSLKIDVNFEERLDFLNLLLADEYKVIAPIGFTSRDNVSAKGLVQRYEDTDYTIYISAIGNVKITCSGQASEIRKLEELISIAFERNLEIEKFARELNEYIGHDSEKNYTPSISTDFIDSCKNKELYAGSLYIFMPDEDLHEKVKEKAIDFAKENKFNFVATTQAFCEDDRDCRGHSVDPLEVDKYRENIFVDEFPNNISGTFVYFFTEENFQTYKQMTAAQ